jgi:hypothetical protein
MESFVSSFNSATIPKLFSPIRRISDVPAPRNPEPVDNMEIASNTLVLPDPFGPVITMIFAPPVLILLDS